MYATADDSTSIHFSPRLRLRFLSVERMWWRASPSRRPRGWSSSTTRTWCTGTWKRRTSWHLGVSNGKSQGENGMMIWGTPIMPFQETSISIYIYIYINIKYMVNIWWMYYLQWYMVCGWCSDRKVLQMVKTLNGLTSQCLGQRIFTTSRHCPEAWFIMVYFREIIPKWPNNSAWAGKGKMSGPTIQVSEIWSFTQIMWYVGMQL